MKSSILFLTPMTSWNPPDVNPNEHMWISLPGPNQAGRWRLDSGEQVPAGGDWHADVLGRAGVGNMGVSSKNMGVS